METFLVVIAILAVTVALGLWMWVATTKEERSLSNEGRRTFSSVYRKVDKKRVGERLRSIRWIRPEIEVGMVVAVFSPPTEIKESNYIGSGEVISRGQRRARIIFPDGSKTRRSVRNLTVPYI